MVSFTLEESTELTSEVARLVTKSNVLRAVLDCTREAYGLDYRRPFLSARPLPRKSPRRVPLTDDMETWLRLAWQHELQLLIPSELGVPQLTRVTAPALGPQAYYALYNAIRALQATHRYTNSRHATLQTTFATQFAKLLPLPWSLRFTGDPKDVSACTLRPSGFVPGPLPSVDPVRTTSHTSRELVFAGLRMTHKWRLRHQVDEWKGNSSNRTRKGKPYKRIPSSARTALVSKLGDSTLLHLLYELRVQMNYRQIEDYLSEASNWNFEDFHEGMLFTTDSGLLAIETLIAERVGFTNFEACVERYLDSLSTIGAWARQRLESRCTAVAVELGP